MARKRIKLFLLVFVGLFVFSIGCIYAQKYQDKNDTKVLSFLSDQDNDQDGLSDSKEKELGTNPYLADSDSDGFNDQIEINNSFDPNKAESDKLIDQDNDGLIGEDEEKYGTDPANSDTDYDGYSDGEEIANGFDPLAANLSNVKALLSAIPQEKKDEAKDITGIDLTSDSSVESLQNILNSQNGEDLQKYVDEIVASSNQNLSLTEVNDADINILAESANSANVASYVENFNNIFKKNLVFLLDPAKQDEMILKYGNSEASRQISQSFLASADQLKQVVIPNSNEFIAVHKKIISALLTLSLKYDIIASSQDSNMPTLTQALKDILALNKILYNEVFVQLNDLTSMY